MTLAQLIDSVGVVEIVAVIGGGLFLFKTWRSFDKERREYSEEARKRSPEYAQQEREALRQQVAEGLDGMGQRVDGLAGKVAEHDAKLEVITKSEVCGLRSQIVQIHKDAMTAGYIARYELQNAEKIYEVYESMGGNSFVHGLMDEIRALPNSAENRAPKGWRRKKGA